MSKLVDMYQPGDFICASKNNALTAKAYFIRRRLTGKIISTMATRILFKYVYAYAIASKISYKIPTAQLLLFLNLMTSFIRQSIF